MNEKVLVVGAGGFIGSRLCKVLTGKGYSVRAVFLNDDEMNRFKNIYNDIAIAEYMIGDIGDYNFCMEISDEVDYVFNMAGVILGTETELHNSNVNGFFNLINASNANGVEKYIYASSSSVYGGGGSVQKESDTVNLTSFYSVSKHIDELYADYYNRIGKMQCIGLRYFNIYGTDNVNARDVVSHFFKAALKGEDLLVHNPNTERDYISADAVVSVTANIVDCDVDRKIGIINVGTGKSTKLLDLAEMIKSIAKSESRIDVRNEYNAIPCSCADVTLLNSFVKLDDEDLYKNLKCLFERNEEKWRAECTNLLQ